jgi:hypothetical protein
MINPSQLSPEDRRRIADSIRFGRRNPATPPAPPAPAPEIPLGGGFSVGQLPPILPQNLPYFSVTSDYRPGALLDWVG